MFQLMQFTSTLLLMICGT